MGQKWDPFEVPQRLHVANPNMEWTEDLCFGDDTFHWPRWLHAHPNWTGAARDACVGRDLQGSNPTQCFVKCAVV